MKTTNQTVTCRKAEVQWRWPSGRIETLTGRILAADESGIRIRWHDWTRGVTSEQTIAAHHIVNFRVIKG